MRNYIEKYGVKKVHTRVRFKQVALRQAGATELCCCPAPPVCLVMRPSLSAPGGQTGCPGHIWATLGHFWAISWHIWTNLRKVQIFLRPRWGRGARF